VDASRNNVMFYSSLPDDSVENDQGDIVVPAGQGILRRICQALEAQAYQPTQPSQHSFYGWESTFFCDGDRIWLLLQDTDPWLLMVILRSGFLRTITRGNSALLKAMGAVDISLQRDDTIRDIRWVNEREYEADQKKRWEEEQSKRAERE
jgi:hypothetical protein